MFEQSMVSRNGGARRAFAVVTSSAIQVLLILLLIAVPVIFTSELPAVVLAGILRSPGPPPPPPAPPPTRTATPASTPRPFELARYEPRVIPEDILIIVEEAPPQVVDAGPSVIGGIGTWNSDGPSVIGSIISQVRQVPPPPPAAKPEPARQPEPQVIQRLRVGGDVKPPVLIHRVEPRYPPIAVQTRTQGVVQIECVIGVDGRVTNMQVINGPALLIQAAVNAVREWRYRPTMLNGDPVEVIMRVDVRFQLR